MGKDNNSEQLVESVVNGMLEKKAKDIIVLDMRKIENAFCLYFVVCHGDSNVHVDAIVDSVDETVKKEIDEKAWSKEGRENAEWVLMDYGDVVVHVFQKNVREFYRIEELWADTAISRIEESFEKSAVS